MESAKPFPCKDPSCTQSFATEDHQQVHQKTHEMLNLNLPPGYIVDKTPTPSRLIRNLEEVGLFEENIFEETFRKAIEEKQNPSSATCSSTPFLRRTISIQNEDTLHTPQIPLHLYKSPARNETTKAASECAIIDVGGKEPKNEESAKAGPETMPTVSPSRRRKRPKRNKRGLDELIPPATITMDAPTIPVNFPDEIQIQPKWTVLLQYPAYETKKNCVKERLQALLVKNESSAMQTVTLTPPPPPAPIMIVPPATAAHEHQEVIREGVAAPVLNVLTTGFVEEPERRNAGGQPQQEGPPVKRVPKEFTNTERNNEAARRYRNKKKELFDGLRQRNEQLEEENKRLWLENEKLRAKLREALAGRKES